MIDSNKLERDVEGKPVAAFSHPALERQDLSPLKFGVGPTVHRSFKRFRAVDVAFRLALAQRLGERVSHGVNISAQSAGATLHRLKDELQRVFQPDRGFADVFASPDAAKPHDELTHWACRKFFPIDDIMRRRRIALLRALSDSLEPESALEFLFSRIFLTRTGAISLENALAEARGCDPERDCRQTRTPVEGRLQRATFRGPTDHSGDNSASAPPFELSRSRKHVPSFEVDHSTIDRCRQRGWNAVARSAPPTDRGGMIDATSG